MRDDQAERLRRQKQAEKNVNRMEDHSKGPVRIAVTSGKGGVGKSNFALNTAITLAEMGQKVLLVDADTNLANLDILLGLNVEYNLSDVITGDRTVADIIVPGPAGIDILPGASGVIEMLDLDQMVQDHLVNALAEMELKYNYIIIDTGAGLNPHIIAYTTSSDDVVIVTTPEPTAFTDAYAMIKVISHRSPAVRLLLLVNMARTAEDAVDVYEKLSLVVQNYLSVPIEYIGFLPTDPNVAAAVAQQIPFTTLFPKCSASAAVRMTTRKLMTGGFRSNQIRSRSLFERLLAPRKSG